MKRKVIAKARTVHKVVHRVIHGRRKIQTFGQRHPILGQLDSEVIHRTASFIVLADAAMKGLKPLLITVSAFGILQFVTTLIGAVRGE